MENHALRAAIALIVTVRGVDAGASPGGAGPAGTGLGRRGGGAPGVRAGGRGGRPTVTGITLVAAAFGGFAGLSAGAGRAVNVPRARSTRRCYANHGLCYTAVAGAVRSK